MTKWLIVADKKIHLAGLWMLGALVSFSLLAVGGRELSAQLSTIQIIFFRCFISMLIVCAIVHWQGWHKVKTRQIGTHIGRNTVHIFGQFGWLYGIAFLPLAQVFAIEFTVPLWTTIIATFLLGEKLNLGRALSVALGLCGILVILRPGLVTIEIASVAVLGCALSYAVAHSLTKKLTRQDNALCIIFYMTLIQLPLSFVPALVNWNWPSVFMWAWILLLAIAGLGAHYCMAKALNHADAMVVVPMDFLRLPLIAIVGFAFYQESMDWFIMLGAAIILMGIMISLYFETLSSATKKN